MSETCLRQAKKLDEDLFEQCWNLTRTGQVWQAMRVVRQWLVLKRVPEYRFDAELQNVQESHGLLLIQFIQYVQRFQLDSVLFTS